MSVGLLSSAAPPSSINKDSFATLITRLGPNGSAPLYGLTSLLAPEPAVNVEHGYFSKTMIFPTLQLDGAIANGAATAFTVDATGDAVPGDLFLVDTTQEIVMVDALVSSTAITMRRGVGSTAAAAIADNVVLRHIGNAFAEASTRPSPVNIVAQYVSNYTQIFRNSWAVSKTLAAMQQVAGNGHVAESRADCAMLHAVAIEKALFFGQKYMGTKDGQPLHTMDVIIARVTAAAPGNITTLGSTTNWTQLEAALDPMLATVTDPKGGSIRTMFCGGTTMRVLTNIARLNASYQITKSETAYGLRIKQFDTPRGTFEAIEHPLFNAYGAASTWARMAVVCDLNAFSVNYLRPTATENYNESGVQVDNGIDAKGGTLTTELTNTIKNPAAFGLIYNFTAAAAG